MALNVNGQPITISYKDPDEKRTDTWLWFWLIDNRINFPQDSYLAPGMKEQINSTLLSNPSLATYCQIDQGRFLLAKEDLAWITDEERQLQWLLPRLNQATNYRLIPPPRLQGRDLAIAIIDTWNVDLPYKADTISRLKQEWSQHKQNDQLFNWFTGADEISRCELAWDWLKEKKIYVPLSPTHRSDHESLLILFDRMLMSVAEIKLAIDAIKKRWSQQQYRKKNTGKKQCNLLLSSQAFDSLDKLAMKYDLSRAQIVEILIRFETERSAYLPEKMKAMKFEWSQMTSSDTPKFPDPTTNQ